MTQIVICGRTGGCCPTVDIRKKDVIIRDDYNGKVRFTTEQWKELKQKIVLGEC